TSSTSTTTAQETTTEAMPDANPSGTYGGNEILAARVSDIVPEAMLISGESIKPSDFTVYKNKYPVGQEGALYEITAEIEKQTEDNFAKFAHILGYEKKNTEYKINEKSFLYDEDSDISSGVESASVIAECAGLSTDTTSHELYKMLKTDRTLKAACEYAGLNDDVVITKSLMYNVDGSINGVDFVIYEKSTSTALLVKNNKFKYVNVVCLSGTKTAAVITTLRTEEKAEIEFTPVSFADAVSECAKRYAQGTGKEADKDRMTTCEVEYSAKIYRDYYVPCYVFTLEVDNPVKDSKLKAFEQYYIPMFTSAEAEIFSAG
ncbi:MAG: hypothetical protein GX851_01215, partial [Clostridiales bacterium]|nr:hypothetical protein [Clostridiales bacterium]